VDSDDEMRELREHAEAQAALFRIGEDEESDESSTEDDNQDSEE
jgi:hypothetical protein